MKENVDSIYCDPNAYIRFKKPETKKEIKQVVFSEPYDCLPNYYLNYGFSKKDCNCVPNCKKENCNQHKNNNNKNLNSNNENDCKHNKGNSFGGLFSGLANFLPILLKGGGNIANILSSQNTNGTNNLPITNLISSLASSQGNNLLSGLLSNGNLIQNLLGMFNKNTNKKINNEDIVTTDYEIKNYTRV